MEIASKAKGETIHSNTADSSCIFWIMGTLGGLIPLGRRWEGGRISSFIQVTILKLMLPISQNHGDHPQQRPQSRGSDKVFLCFKGAVFVILFYSFSSPSFCELTLTIYSFAGGR